MLKKDENWIMLFYKQKGAFLQARLNNIIKKYFKNCFAQRKKCRYVQSINNISPKAAILR